MVASTQGLACLLHCVLFFIVLENLNKELKMLSKALSTRTVDLPWVITLRLFQIDQQIKRKKK